MDIFSSHLVKIRKIEMIMYTFVALSVDKDLSNLKTLEHHFQAEYHYPECMELKVMFQILDSVSDFGPFTYTLYLEDGTAPDHRMHLFHTLYSVVSCSFTHYLLCP